MRKILLFFTLFLLPAVLTAQIEFPGNPWSRETSLKSSPEVFTLPGLTSKAAAAYLSTFSPQTKAMVFAYPFDTLMAADRNGTWETLVNGSRIWRISIHSPGAQSLNLIFSKFVLPEGASVYLYTPAYATVRGAFTSGSHAGSSSLATVPLPGDRIMVELNVPPDAAFTPELEISRVSHDFKGFFSFQGIQTSGDCNVDINCPEGDNWQVEKRSVVKFIRGGSWLCTGALINNTRIDGRPLLLTANHTIGTKTHAEQSIFFFRYERPGCGSGEGTLRFTLSGSKLLATTSNLDFSLVELNMAPPPEYEPYYAGWDRRVFTFLDTVTCIHHPNGDVKKISKSFRKVYTADFGGGYDTNTHWKISAWDIGTTEPGSSGSPLFTTDHRIVGDLTGGDASCSYNFNDYFAKFSVSWDKYPDSSNQLKYWLDPQQTGLMVLNGYDPNSGDKPVANFKFRPERIQVGRKVYFTSLSAGKPNTWTWSFGNASPATSSLEVPEPVKFMLPGTYHVTLRVSNSWGSDSLQQTITVSDYAAYSISETRIVPDHTIELTDQSTGQPVTIYWSVENSSVPLSSGPGVELSFPRQGYYTITEVVEFQDFTEELIHYNQVRVIPELLAFRSFNFNNVQRDEHAGYTDMGAQGYIPGSNSQGITAFAQAFRNTSDTVFTINGITVPLEVISSWPVKYFLPVVIWNANKQVVVRDSVNIAGLGQKSRITQWFRSPVNFDTLLYAGFEVRPWSEGSFVAKMATDRGEIGANSAFLIKGNQWQPLTDTGVHTSLDISLETSILLNSFIEEIDIIPNISNGNLLIDLGNLVYSKVDIVIYNMLGQKVITDLARSGNQVIVQIKPPVAGIYVVRLIIDNYKFPKPFRVIWR